MVRTLKGYRELELILRERPAADDRTTAVATKATRAAR